LREKEPVFDNRTVKIDVRRIILNADDFAADETKVWQKIVDFKMEFVAAATGLMFVKPPVNCPNSAE